MAELDTITVKGFKSIASIEDLKLGPINVLIGANGSGKSNFIEVFSFLNAIREGRLQRYVAEAGGAEKVLHFGSKQTRNLLIRLSFQDGQNGYEINLQPARADQLVPEEEGVWFWGDRSRNPRPFSDAVPSAGREAGISDPQSRGIPLHVRKHLAACRVYHFHDTGSISPMKRRSNINDNRFLKRDGSNLAAFLYLLRQRHQDSYELVRRTVQLVAPFFDDFLLEPLELKNDEIKLEWRHRKSDAYFDASALSDGTLRFMALATLFLQPENYRPSVIVVDEPELGLHPYAITVLSSLVRSVSAHTQVVLSTQSSLLLDHFQPEEVLVAELVDEGTVLARLEPDKLKTWLEDYSLGQLWEKNELGGRPGAYSTACPGS